MSDPGPTCPYCGLRPTCGEAMCRVCELEAEADRYEAREHPAGGWGVYDTQEDCWHPTEDGEDDWTAPARDHAEDLAEQLEENQL